MMKMAAGSENESDDGGEIVIRTPALSSNEESFSQNSSASKTAISTVTSLNEAKKVKVSPSKAKPSATTTPGSNSKSNSPSKNNKKAAASTTTPSKGKSTKK